jgi:hypothetical protein
MRWVLAVAPKDRTKARQTTNATASRARVRRGCEAKKRRKPRSDPPPLYELRLELEDQLELPRLEEWEEDEECEPPE